MLSSYDAAVDVDARRNPPTEEIGIGEAELVALRVRAAADGDAQIVAAAEEIPLRQRDVADDAVAARIADAERELAGRLLDHLHDDDDAIVRGAGLGEDAHVAEIAKALQPALGAIDQHAVEGIALGDVELAADDVVARARVAAHLDALDVDARALVDDVGDADRQRVRIAVEPRPRLRERIAVRGEVERDLLERLLDLAAGEDIALVGRDLPLQDRRVDAGNAGIDGDLRRTGSAGPRSTVNAMKKVFRSRSRSATEEMTWKSA